MYHNNSMASMFFYAEILFQCTGITLSGSVLRFPGNSMNENRWRDLPYTVIHASMNTRITLL